MPASKARKAARQRQLKAAEAQDLPADAPQEPQAEETKTNGADNDAQKAEEKPKTGNPNKAPVKGQAESNTKPRFIVFVGKLPYTATNETIKQHFAKLEPSSIRHLTKKETGQSKGCAFLEFERYDQMKECLKLYHNSLFDDGRGGEKRRINIELTVGGGGGKSRDRKAKLRAKNEKLADERQRRATERRKEGKGTAKRPKQQGDDSAEPAEDSSGMHPSRLARMQH